jgi:tRNA modification GTPase
LRLVIAGKPNVGKSSLFNRLLGTERAIVTEMPGTTRDLLSETASIAGIPVRFCDTAGIRDAGDLVEGLGVERSLDALADADLVLVVLDGSRPFDSEDARVLALVKEISHLIVLNKSDLQQAGNGPPAGAVRVSAKTGAGFEALGAAIEERFGRRSGGGPESILTNVRQHEAVGGAIEALERGARALGDGTPSEMALLDFYAALGELNSLTGEVVTEDILGRIFSRFCVGK